MSTKAALKTTTESPEADHEAAAVSKLGLAEFYLSPRLSVQFAPDGSVTLIPFDASMKSEGLLGSSLTMTVVPGPVLGYRLDSSKSLDLRQLLANHLTPSLRIDPSAAATIAELERDIRLLRMKLMAVEL